MPAYVEHSALARLLGFHLVEAPDLVVRRGRLWLRTLGGLDPIDVVYRRLPDAVLDPIEASASSSAGVPGLVLASAEGGVVLANGHGSGVLEDPDARAVLAGRGRGAHRDVADARLDVRRDDDLAGVPAFRRRPGRHAPASSSACTPWPDPTA